MTLSVRLRKSALKSSLLQTENRKNGKKPPKILHCEIFGGFGTNKV